MTFVLNAYICKLFMNIILWYEKDIWGFTINRDFSRNN
jgi:hypothetical protein